MLMRQEIRLALNYSDAEEVVVRERRERREGAAVIIKFCGNSI
jgi:hypothetical protein